MKTIPLSRLDALFAAIAQTRQLYLPVDDPAGQAQFTLWHANASLSRRLNTARSAKDLFFPQVETLAGFRMEGQKLELLKRRAETTPFVLFGVRACDCRSLRADGHLLSGASPDGHRRHACLHAAGGDLLLLELRYRRVAAAGRRELLDG